MYRYLHLLRVGLISATLLACNVYEGSLPGGRPDASTPSTTGSGTVASGSSGTSGTDTAGTDTVGGGGSTNAGTTAGTTTAATTTGGGGEGPMGTGGSSGTSGSGGSSGGSSGTGGSSGAGGSRAGASGAGGSRAGASGAGGSGGKAGAGGSAGGSSGSSGASGNGGSASTEAGAPDASVDTGALADASPGGAVFAVGSFVKTTAAGAQVVPHTLGQAPKAIILWTAGKTDATATGDYLYSVGTTDMQRASMSGSMSGRDAVSPTTTGRRMANKALSIVQWDRVAVAEADITAWDASSLTLDWTTNNTAPYVIHYIAIGGPAVSSKVISWQVPTSAASKSITGVGFQPAAVLNFYVGFSFILTPPASDANAGFGIGMMDRSGGQCATHARASDAKMPTLAGRSAKTDSAFYITSEVGPTVAKRATFVSMDSDGFTMSFATSNSSASQAFSLALSGVQVKVGAFAKTVGGAPSVQPVGSVGFKPGMVFLTSVQDAAEAGIAVDHARFGIGASDGAHEASSAMSDTTALTTAAASAVDSTDGAFLKMDNATRTVDAKASLASFDPDGFTMSWSTNDAVATQVCYLAIGAP